MEKLAFNHYDIRPATVAGTFGTGLGQKLMDLVLDWTGDSKVTLDVAVYNARAIRFYDKFGFQMVPYSEHLFRDKIPCVKMRRRCP